MADFGLAHARRKLVRRGRTRRKLRLGGAQPLHRSLGQVRLTQTCLNTVERWLECACSACDLLLLGKYGWLPAIKTLAFAGQHIDRERKNSDVENECHNGVRGDDLPNVR